MTKLDGTKPVIRKGYLGRYFEILERCHIILKKLKRENRAFCKGQSEHLFTWVS